jgi:hypothetical protein
MMVFNTSTSYLHKKLSLSFLKINDEIDLGVRYLNFSKTTNFGSKNIPHSKKIGEFILFVFYEAISDIKE